MDQELALWHAAEVHMRQADTACALTGWQHVSAQNDIVAATLNVWRYIKMTPCQTIRSYFENNHAKCYADPIQNDTALGFFWRGHPSKKKHNNNKVSSDMRSVSG